MSGSADPKARTHAYVPRHVVEALKSQIVPAVDSGDRHASRPAACYVRGMRLGFDSAMPLDRSDRAQVVTASHRIALARWRSIESRCGSSAAEQRRACVRAIIEVVVRRPMPKPPLNPSQWPRAAQSTDAFFRAMASSGTDRSTRRRRAAGGRGELSRPLASQTQNRAATVRSDDRGPRVIPLPSLLPA